MEFAFAVNPLIVASTVPTRTLALSAGAFAIATGALAFSPGRLLHISAGGCKSACDEGADTAACMGACDNGTSTDTSFAEVNTAIGASCADALAGLWAVLGVVACIGAWAESCGCACVELCVDSCGCACIGAGVGSCACALVGV